MLISASRRMRWPARSRRCSDAVSNLVTFLVLGVVVAAGVVDWMFFDAAALTWLGQVMLRAIDWLAFWR